MVEAVWDPEQYHRYTDLRLRPAIELFSRVSVDNPSLVHDIGTGGGEIARLMAQRWPSARVIASDSSAEMLQEARAVTPPNSSIEWKRLDLDDWQPGPEHDVLYGNAVLHWLPEHEELFPRLLRGVRPGGELAVQMPLSWYQPSHRAIRATLAAMDTPEADLLVGFMSKPNALLPEDYYDILRPEVRELDIWTTEYHHVMTGDDPIFEFTSGSILRPVFTQLPESEFARFSAMCKAAMRSAYPQRPDGTTLFPFRRVFIVARC